MRGKGFLMDGDGVLVANRGVGIRHLGIREKIHHLKIKTMKIM